MSRIPYGLRIRHFIVPKRGSEPAECEDSIAINAERLVFAVADGATEAYDSRSWAKLLVKSWVRIDPPALEMEDFEPLVEELGRRLHHKWARRKLPWYAEEKAQGGSFAAFILLNFFPIGTEVRWRASALGDCCLIQRGGSARFESFPLSRSEEFGNNPFLLPSLKSKQRLALDAVRHIGGIATPGHNFLLVTDAVGAWYLKQFEEGETTDVERLDNLMDSEDRSGLEEFFANLRNIGKIKNDDIAIVRIVVY